MGLNHTPASLIFAIKAHGFTQVQIAERAGLTQGAVSKIERGSVTNVMTKSYFALLALYQELESAKPAKKRKLGR